MNIDLYKISSPRVRYDELVRLNFQKIAFNPEVQNALTKADEHYLFWDELQYKNWIPENIFPDKELFWTLLKVNRALGLKSTLIKDVNSKFFQVNVNVDNEFLHNVDKEMAGSFMGITDFSENDKEMFITRKLIDEAIASSQLEGANTSRTVAKKMLLEGRKPRNHSERMIVNNYLTMQKIEQKFCKEKLSWELLCELHRMITDKTIPEEKQGVLRDTFDNKGNRLIVKPWHDKSATYITPDRKFVEQELPRLIAFANDEPIENTTFIHPLIKAIMLHFWIGLLHPFEDGNGRLARILFYWYMLKHEYWAFAYLSLSEKIKKSPKEYAMAYVYSKQDDCDLTYFVHYNIEKLKLARQFFQTYLRKKIAENRQAVILSTRENNLNERQIKLLRYFHQHIESRANIAAHQKLHRISKLTAINDLQVLIEKDFLYKRKQGRNVYYYPTEKVEGLFK